jgi:tetratricopeptide (TPR) repeat protein
LVAAALESAHGLGIVHGDLKASKVLRDARGSIRVTDFRIAVALRTAMSAAVVGDHLSLQVRTGETPVAADDIYSLGTLLAQTLAPASVSDELRVLIDAMRAEQRDARPTDLREIRQTLAANSQAGERAAGATLSTESLARPPATVATRSDERLGPQPSPGPSRNLQYAAAAGVLAVAALLVFFALPRWVESARAPQPPVETEELAEREMPSLPAAAPTASKSSAESLLAQLPPLRERLEVWAIERWGAEDYAEATALESQGDAAFIDGEYGTAYARYDEALTAYSLLSQRRDVVLAKNLESGSSALEASERQRAIDSFDLALAIEPDNVAALGGARRAENLGEVLAHMDAGERFEADGALDAAAREYAQAVEIDPQSAPAREALARVEAVRAAEAYQTNLSLALTSMANSNLGAARTHFERARALRPGSPEVAEGLRQLQQIESSNDIETQRRLAETAESAEQWSDAASHYQTITETQAHLQFAEDGLQRTRELARITGRMAALIEDPTQLFRPEVFTEARELMALGKAAAEGSPLLAEQLGHLEIAVQLASTPIAVVFQSDTVTEVVIRGVGTLGGFARRDVPLKPGHYVVVGRRDGYRDTRREISVLPGRQLPVIEVRCTEKI